MHDNNSHTGLKFDSSKSKMTIFPTDKYWYHGQFKSIIALFAWYHIVMALPMLLPLQD